MDESMLVIRVAIADATAATVMGSKDSEAVCVDVGGVRKWIGGEGGEEEVDFPCPPDWICFSLLHRCCMYGETAEAEMAETTIHS